jgi:hypothetical protein
MPLVAFRSATAPLAAPSPGTTYSPASGDELFPLSPRPFRPRFALHPHLPTPYISRTCGASGDDFAVPAARCGPKPLKTRHLAPPELPGAPPGKSSPEDRPRRAAPRFVVGAFYTTIHGSPSTPSATCPCPGRRRSSRRRGGRLQPAEVERAGPWVSSVRAGGRLRLPVAVDLAPVADRVHEDCRLLADDLVDHPIVTNPELVEV